MQPAFPCRIQISGTFKQSAICCASRSNAKAGRIKLPKPARRLKHQTAEYWLAPTGPLLTVLGFALYSVNRLLMRCLFRLRVKGVERLPSAGPLRDHPQPCQLSRCPGRRSGPELVAFAADLLGWRRAAVFPASGRTNFLPRRPSLPGRRDASRGRPRNRPPRPPGRQHSRVVSRGMAIARRATAAFSAGNRSADAAQCGARGPSLHQRHIRGIATRPENSAASAADRNVRRASTANIPAWRRQRPNRRRTNRRPATSAIGRAHGSPG